MPYSQEELVAIRRHLHQIPELGFEEFKTSQFLKEKILEITATADNIEIKEWRTGFLVMIKGSAPSKIVGWRTDIDALPILEEVENPFKSQHTGRMHACGHDFHMTIALGILKRAIETTLTENLVIQFQPSEEFNGGAKIMYESGIFGDWLPDEFYALHVKPDLPVGTISTRIGALFAGALMLDIKFKGKGGHAAFPHLSNDMVIAASAFVQQVQTIVSRNIDPLSSGLLSFCALESGSARNIISDETRLSGTLRALNKETFDTMLQHLRQISEGIALSFGCEVLLDIHQGEFLPVDNNPLVTEKFIKYMSRKAGVNYEESLPAMTGEDFAYTLSKTDGMVFWLGVNSQYNLHHSKFNPDESALDFGVRHTADYLFSICGEK
ncbi:MAG: N-acetyldiaminopimelate deacetylase [Streptococcaceae bacterium]|jgi:N-acetyldiaminopimelate deacetylase|nr:N-acetyldiaminopimelate deacetylase [Streptococcaceae bacterium]MCH4178027.1 N-acetyldiaminopimelate deacetylase [Streptococcaceae bacterium]